LLFIAGRKIQLRQSIFFSEYGRNGALKQLNFPRNVSFLIVFPSPSSLYHFFVFTRVHFISFGGKEGRSEVWGALRGRGRDLRFISRGERVFWKRKGEG
jgi:hypothetical protein